MKMSANAQHSRCGGTCVCPNGRNVYGAVLQSPLKFEIHIGFIKQFQGFYSIDMLEGANSTHRHENSPLASFIVAGSGNTQCPLIDSHVHHSHTEGGGG